MSRRVPPRSNPWSLLRILALLHVAGPATAAPKAIDPRTMPHPAVVGMDSVAIRARLTAVSSAAISRACGNISYPWAYRGERGRQMAMRTFGRHSGDRDWARAFAAQLLEITSVVASEWMPSTQTACDEAASPAVYLVTLQSGEQTTRVLVRFDIGAAVLFDAEQPLGLLQLGSHADSLWLLLATRLDDDPVLHDQRPTAAPALWDSVRAESYRLVDELPQEVQTVAPEYPASAQAQGIDGCVWVHLRVGTDGAVHDAFVESGPMELRDAALEALWQWKFTPGKVHGNPVPVWVATPVNFRLH